MSSYASLPTQEEYSDAGFFSLSRGKSSPTTPAWLNQWLLRDETVTLPAPRTATIELVDLSATTANKSDIDSASAKPSSSKRQQNLILLLGIVMAVLITMMASSATNEGPAKTERLDETEEQSEERVDIKDKEKSLNSAIYSQCPIRTLQWMYADSINDVCQFLEGFRGCYQYQGLDVYDPAFDLVDLYSMDYDEYEDLWDPGWVYNTTSEGMQGDIVGAVFCRSKTVRTLDYQDLEDFCSQYEAVDLSQLSVGQIENTEKDGKIAVDTCPRGETHWLNFETWGTVCWMQEQAISGWGYSGPVDFCNGIFSPYRVSGVVMDDLCRDSTVDRRSEFHSIGAELCTGTDFRDLKYEDWRSLCEQMAEVLPKSPKPSIVMEDENLPTIENSDVNITSISTASLKEVCWVERKSHDLRDYQSDDYNLCERGLEELYLSAATKQELCPRKFRDDGLIKTLSERNIPQGTINIQLPPNRTLQTLTSLEWREICGAIH
ncbi:MAG: hypothetical protein SGBAC_004863 [Bacillariaceae sp.]